MKTETQATLKQVNTIQLNDYVENTDFDKVKSSAFDAYALGRQSTYKAVALAYMWYELAKTDEKYIKLQFESMRTKTQLNNYTNTVKCCFKLDSTSQASTISKYARVLGYISKQSKTKVKKSTDENKFASDIAKLITDAGGLDACARAYSTDELGKAAAANTSVRMSAEEVDIEMKRFKNKRKKALSSFAHGMKLGGSDGELVIMIGRVNDNNIDVMDIMANSDLVRQVIRKK